MKIGILGTGMVGKTLATRLVELDHEVKMGSRTRDNPEATAWALAHGEGASHGTFADAAGFGELLVNATAGTASLTALEAAGADNLGGKTLMDVANTLDFSHGVPPSLAVVNTDSLGEQIQRTYPGLKVVKALNTMNCVLMADPAKLSGSHNVFVCGNDAQAKSLVMELLRSLGWPAEDIIDLGDIGAARGTEMLLPLWIRLMGVLGTPQFNFKIVR